MAIIDQHGNPLQSATLSEPQTARMGQLHHEFATHPTRGLTPQKLARILEEAEQGDILAQHDLFLDMEEKDAHIYAEMSKRRRAILTVPWSIEPPRNASAAEKTLAADLDDLLRDIPNIEDVLLDMMDGIGHGFACLEIEWAKQGRDWLPSAIEHRPQSWFRLDRETRTELRLRDLSTDGAPLQPFRWIAHVHRAKSGYIARAGLHRILAWPYLYKNYSVRDLAEFLEIYGLPLRLGKYPPGASDKEKATLLSAVVNIGHNAAGIIPEGMNIEIMEAAKGSQDPFTAMMQWAESSMSKAILGGTLTSQADGKSSTNALGKVHEEVRHDILESDARQIASTLNDTLIHYLVALNHGGISDARRMPRWVFDTSMAADFALYAEAIPKLSGLMDIPESWAQDMLKIPAPKDGEAVLGSRQPVSDQLPAVERGRPARNDPKASETLALPADTPAALSALIAESQPPDAIDQLAAQLAGDWREVVTPLSDPIQAALDESHANYETAEQFLARLPGLLENMDTAALTEKLARAAFAARLLGESGLELSTPPQAGEG